MNRWKRKRENPQLDARLASKLLDEALRVFGMLEACMVADPTVDDDFRELLGIAARDLLDDVACLSHMAATAPPVLSWPRDPSDLRPNDLQPLICRAVDELGAYAKRLAATAIVLTNRGGDAARVFNRLALAAEARMAFLGS
jgi:hypothetical protein